MHAWLQATEWEKRCTDFLVGQLLAHGGEAGAKVVCEAPNNKIHDFSGTYSCPGSEPQTLGIQHLLMRGCSLVDTQWVIGLVMTVGKDCKVCRVCSLPMPTQPHTYS